MKYLRKLFGGLKMTWPRVMISAVVTAAYTALMLLLPVTKNTSFRDIGIHYPCWILFALIIITNCKTPKEAAAKTFVFFLISQPLVFLLEVPFSGLGWGIFRYYPGWFAVTLLTLPGAYLGWFTRSKRILAGVILSPMLFLLTETALMHLNILRLNVPRMLLALIFCIASAAVYLVVILTNGKQRAAAIICTALMLGGMRWIEARDRGAGRAEQLPDGIHQADVAEITVSEPELFHVYFDEDTPDLLRIDAVKPECAGEVSLYGQNGDLLACYTVEATKFVSEADGIKVIGYGMNIELKDL